MLTAVINCLTSLLAGFVVFAVLGYMAHIRHSTVEELALQGKSSPEDTEFLSCSAEHEIFSANKYENAKKSWHFIFISREIFMLNYV